MIGYILKIAINTPMKALYPFIFSAIFASWYVLFEIQQFESDFFYSTDLIVDLNNTSASTIATASVINAFQDSLTSLKTTNSSEYIWVGNEWVPPPGVPTFTPSQLLDYFQRRNVLFIGDSTMRRAYANLYDMINATDLTNIRYNDLVWSYRIDFKKKVPIKHKQCELEERGVVREKAKVSAAQYECRDAPGASYESKIVGNNTIKHTKKGRFDYSYFSCFSQTSWFLRSGSEELGRDESPVIPILKHDYDLVIVGLGVWEIVYPLTCELRDKGTTISERLQWLLTNLTALSSPEMQVVFRTPGYDSRFETNHTGVKEMTETIDNYFQESKNQVNSNSNITVVDWSTVMEKRSFDGARIAGDIPPHYGVQARTLFIQQLMHELVKLDI